MNLDPEIAAVVALQAADDGVPAHERPLAEVRAAHDAETALLSGPGESVAQVRSVSAGGVPLRVYRPAGEGPPAVVAYFHGGGWAVGSLDSFDTACRALANASGAIVASVDYRLAPEHPFPAGLEDCRAATRWLAAHAGELGGDGARLAVAGDSAGGNLAAVVALRERACVRFQLLIYPVCDPGLATPSYRAFSEGFGLTAATMARYWDLYVGDGERRDDPDAAPVRATDLAGAPPAFVLTASHDVLRDEGLSYVEALRAAGVPVEHREYPGTTHGFWRWLARTSVSRLAVADAGAAVRAALRSP